MSTKESNNIKNLRKIIKDQEIIQDPIALKDQEIIRDPITLKDRGNIQDLKQSKDHTNIDKMSDRQKKPFRFVVFSGGGAKGGGLPGALKAMEEYGTFNKVERLGGASAGALCTVMAGSGIASQILENKLKELDFKDQVGRNLINKPAHKLEQFIRQNTSESISEYIQSKKLADNIEEIKTSRIKELTQNIEQAKKINPRDDLEIEYCQSSIKLLNELNKDKILELDNRLKKLLTKNVHTKNDKGPTFIDMAYLNAIEPKKFKKISLIAVRQDNGKPKIFDEKTSPNVDIAVAAHASSAIPLIFKPVEIDGVKYVDGGVEDNIPINPVKGLKNEDSIAEVIEAGKEQEYLKSDRTLAFAFGNKTSDSGFTAIYSSKKKISTVGSFYNFVVGLLQKLGGGKFNLKYKKSDEKTMQRLRNNALDTVLLDHDKVGTLSFDNAEHNVKELSARYYLDTAERLECFFEKENNYLPEKRFVMNLYTKINTNSLTDKTKNKFLKDKNEKLYELLDLCKQDNVNHKNSTDILKSCLTTAATKRSGVGLDYNTNTMNNLVKMLNDKTTPTKIKKQFLAISDIKDTQYKNQKNIDNVKFTTENFKVLLQEIDQEKKNKTHFLEKVKSEKIYTNHKTI